MFASASHPLRGHPFARSSIAAPYPLFVSAAALEFRDFMQRYTGKHRAAGPRVESAGSVEGVKRTVVSDTAALRVIAAFAIARSCAWEASIGSILRPPPPRIRLRALLSPSGGAHPWRSMNCSKSSVAFVDSHSALSLAHEHMAPASMHLMRSCRRGSVDGLAAQGEAVRRADCRLLGRRGHRTRARTETAGTACSASPRPINSFISLMQRWRAIAA